MQNLVGTTKKHHIYNIHMLLSHSYNFNGRTMQIGHDIKQIHSKHGGLPWLRQSAGARVSHRQGRRRRRRRGDHPLTWTQPLCLHVLLLPPRTQMHFLFLHAFLGRQTQYFN